jgi:hypothetical protein
MPDMVRLVEVTFPEMNAPPATLNVDEGVTVPMPRRALTLSQKRLGLFSYTVPLVLPIKRRDPFVSVVVAPSGGVTVQFKAPGLHDGVSVSPGAYGDEGGSANACGAYASTPAKISIPKIKIPIFPRLKERVWKRSDDQCWMVEKNFM